MARRKKSPFDDPVLKALCRPPQRYSHPDIDRMMFQSPPKKDKPRNDTDLGSAIGGLVGIVILLSAVCGNPLALLFVLLAGGALFLASEQ